MLQEASIGHRVGNLPAGDTILLIVVSAAHRKETFAGCEYILGGSRSVLPLWKHEFFPGGDRWVEGNRE